MTYLESNLIGLISKFLLEKIKHELYCSPDIRAIITENKQLINITYHTSSNIVDGFFHIHTRPVVKHIANTGSTVYKSHVIFTAFRYRTKTENNNITLLTLYYNLFLFFLQGGLETPISCLHSQKNLSSTWI